MTLALDTLPDLSRTGPLVSPRALRDAEPASADAALRVADSRDALRAILTGADDRVAVVVGPCSVHDPIAALDYARRLAVLADEVGDRLQVIMRVYFEKPRTSVGWKGLLSDPGLDGSDDLDAGLRAARRILAAIVDGGLPTATEFLDPALSGHLSDLVTYGAIGARTASSQVHRQMVSGLPMPVGIKNGTDGDVQVAVDGVRSARSPHVYAGVDDDGRLAAVRTTGNEDAHVILRGGSSGPNYDAASVTDAGERLRRSGADPRVVVDVSHGNSAKNHRRQLDVLGDLADRIAGGDRGVVGVMVESFLVEGRQDLGTPGEPLTYGQSITDACLGWADTERAVRALADAVSARRAVGTGR
ncbi:3-deoxy-7-phosphoheptulonate synthase [Rhodococcus sp. SORGH_AS_0303]|uniref:3-deoxy-7-phosphoheptulonate synthase n=1 Tax=Rhodococcus sp. SORGH_AS_0303 TaxID=3041753 RepID=UPI0027846A9F|nr:3-deoxy-7-phosphoheptulonate synthase [Rhodococcus sp. SORGH_AS_0303]MDQ1202809.1 3-deoxy-7-phosphoheptulonate synthase [Rhodococcus sp. SORGH_AS_0303]